MDRFARTPKRICKSKNQKDIFDAMQSLEYEINTLFTSNGQTPFTSLGFGLEKTGLKEKFKKQFYRFESMD